MCSLRVGNLDEGVKVQAAGNVEGDYFPFMCHDGHFAYASLDFGGETLDDQCIKLHPPTCTPTVTQLQLCCLINSWTGCADAERVLWYSREYQDWNINAGLEAKPVRWKPFPPYQLVTFRHWVV